MSLTKIIKEFTEKQLEFMEQYGADIVAWKQTEDYEMLLYEDPHIEKFTGGKVQHQIGFQRRGMDFTNKNQVMDKHIPDDVSISDLRRVESTIRKWLEKYQKIGVGSNNIERAKTYERIFRRLGFNVQKKKINMGDEDQLLVYLEK